MLTFPKTLVDAFVESHEYQNFKNHPEYRLGQAFHNFARLYKISNPDDKAFCDKLWEADGVNALFLIAERYDENN